MLATRRAKPGECGSVRCCGLEAASGNSSKMSRGGLATRRIARCRKEVVMSYRYNMVDIVVGVGMCAIIFGALLFFVAANGSYHAAILQPISIEESAGDQLGMTFLQPTLGQAVVDQARLERRTDQVMAQSASEWNRATLAYDTFQSRSGSPFEIVTRQASMGPVDHMARVQGVLGRAVVNFTQRGIRSGVLSADQYRSGFNANMIRATEERGKRMDHEFASTWQAILGREIVNAIQHHTRQAGMIQGQLGSLVVAAIRTEALLDRFNLAAAIESSAEPTTVASTEPVAWPEIPLGYLIAACFTLGVVYLAGLTWTAQRRETKTLTEMRRDAAKWTYRPAA